MGTNQYGVLSAAVTTSAGAEPPGLLPANVTAQITHGAERHEQNCALFHGVERRNATVVRRPIRSPGQDTVKCCTSRDPFEYLKPLMPLDNPPKIADAEKLAIPACMLERNSNLKPDAKLRQEGGAVPLS
jgi:hypothetical protein